MFSSKLFGFLCCNSKEGVLCIPQNSSITGVSPSICLRISRRLVETGFLPLCRNTVGIFYSSRFYILGSHLWVQNICLKILLVCHTPDIYFFEKFYSIAMDVIGIFHVSLRPSKNKDTKNSILIHNIYDL